MDDIIATIRRNEEVGNLSSIDAINLIDLTSKLYMQIYAKYKEMGEFTMRLFDQSMELAGDKYEKSVEELEDEVAEMKKENLNLQNEIISLKDIINNLQKELKSIQEK